MNTQTNTENLNPAQKAWVTRRALAALRASTAVPAAAAPAPVALPSSGHVAPGVVRPIELAEWQKPKAAIVEAPETFDRVTEFEMVTLWVDEPEVGCGFHRFVVVERSDRFIRLFHPSRLSTILIGRKYFDKKAKPADRCKRKSVAAIIERNIKMAIAVNDRKQADVMVTGGTWGELALQLAIEGRLQ